MWRGRARYFSTYTSPLPNAESASDRASWNARAKSSASFATRIPFPPPPAAALMITGKPISRANAERLVHVLHRAGRARNDRHADVGHRFARRGLVAHQADLLRRGTDERDVRRGARLRELRVLGEKAVAGMDRVRARDLGGRDQARDLEIRLARRRRPDAHVVVGEADVERLAIGLRVDGHRLNAELAARADDSKRDLAAIGDQNFLEHQLVYPAWRRDWPAVLSAIAIALKVVPARVAGSLDTLRAECKLARVGGEE